MRHLVLSAALLAGCRSCVAVDSAVAYPCRPDSGDAQCAQGWRCGLDGRCHDTSVGAALPCASDGDCEQRWRCGLDGTCHARDAGAAYLCESDTDCEQDWRCTCCEEPKHCHPRGIASDYPCASDGDCEQGWQCGLNGRCHARDAGAPYACRSDADCAPAWRCGLESFCVDTTFEGLQPAYEGPLTVELLSPVLGAERAEIAAASRSPRAFTFARDGGLHHYMDSPDGTALSTFTLALDGGPLLGLVTLGPRSYFLDEGGLTEVSWLDGGVRRIDDGGGAQHLRALDNRNALVGFGPNAVWLYDADTQAMSRAATVPAQVADVTVRQAPWSANTTAVSVVAATADGLFSAYVTDGGLQWQARQLPSVPNAQCGPAPGDAGTLYRPVAVDAQAEYNDTGFAVAVEDPGTGQLLFEGPEYFFDCTQSWATNPPWPCPVCAPGELESFAVAAGQMSWPVVLCQSATGPMTAWSLPLYNFGEDMLTSCAPAVSWGGFDHGRSFRATQGQIVLATSHGVLWQVQPFGPDDTLVNASLPFSSVIRTQDGGLWANGWPLEDGIGFGVTAVKGIPDGPLEQDPGPLSAQATTPDGGQWTVSAGSAPRNDVLVAGESDAGLTFRLSPRPFSPLISVAALPAFARADGGVPFIAGYALTVDSLFYFEAASPQQWRAQEIVAPPARYVAVWTDGPAGRLAADDGTVRSLPSLIPLSDPLPDAGTVARYSVVCGQPYALGAAGLFRLERAPTGLGSWAAVDLSGVIPGYAFDTGLTSDSRIDRLGQDLFLSTDWGAVVRLSVPASCP